MAAENIEKQSQYQFRLMRNTNNTGVTETSE